MMKKVLAVMLAVAMVFCFAACGQKEEAKKEETKTTIKIGGMGPLTGDYANYGTSVEGGAKIAVEEVNKAGGINGMQIEFSMQDSQGDGSIATAAYGKLVDWGMDVSIGTTFSGEMTSVSQASADDDILLLSPSASDDNCIKSNSKAFRICFYDSYQGTAAADYVKDHNMGTKVGVFYQSDLNYSVGLYNAFVEECKKVGIEIVETQSFTKDTNTNFDTQVEALVKSGVKLIFMPIYAAEASTFLAQAKNGEAGAKFASDVFFFGADGLDGILTKVADNPKRADNVLMLTPFAADSKDAAVQSFVKAYNAAYGKDPDQFAADAYDAIYTIKAAVEAANSTSGKVLAEQMTKLTVNGITGKMTWSADGNTSKPAQAVLYKDGVGALYTK